MPRTLRQRSATVNYEDKGSDAGEQANSSDSSTDEEMTTTKPTRSRTRSRRQKISSDSDDDNSSQNNNNTSSQSKNLDLNQFEYSGRLTRRRRNKLQRIFNDEESSEYSEEVEDDDEEELVDKPSKTRRRGRTRKTRSSTSNNKLGVRVRSKKSNYKRDEDLRDAVVASRNLRSRGQVTYAEVDSDEDMEEDGDMYTVSKPKKNKRAVNMEVDKKSDEDDIEEQEIAFGSDEDEKGEQEEDEEEEEEDEDYEEDDIVEKILAMKEFEIDDGSDSSSDKENDSSSSKDSDKPKETEVKYLVKFKDQSYLHTEWVTEEFIVSQPQGKGKLSRFLKSYDPDLVDEDEGYFPDDYIQVDRILDETRLNGKKIFFVKWKGLPYSESTWEWADDIDDDLLIAQFYRFRRPPAKSARKIPPRPSVSSFKELAESPKFKNDNELRDYQLEGLNWLLYCWYNRRNSILADEMGLGKTVQTVAIIETIRTQNRNRGPFLVIVPLSTIEHWKREFESWTHMNVIVYHGSSEDRDMIKHYEFYYYDSKNKRIPGIYKFNVLITTYEMVLKESTIFKTIPWQYMVIDEGHRLKNRNSKLLEALRNVKTEHKLLLTGTPIQNNLGELWTLLNFLNPNTFKSESNFMKEFGELSKSTQVADLHKMIGPYLLRRMKEDVEKSIPPKEEILVEVELTNIQKTYYRAILDRNKKFLRQGVKKNSNFPNLINILMEIRKVCNHPFLIKGAEEKLTKGMNEEQVNELLIKASTKMVVVDKLLRKLRAGGHKVLIFSQMVRVLDILEDFLTFRGYPCERIDGRVRGNQRQMAIDRFSKPDSDSFVFLLCTRAGGIGINLAAADTVIIFDSDWNPQNDLQAQSRCHRIGQESEVKVYRLITKNTKERMMFESASKKLGLDRAVLNMNKPTEYKNQKTSTATTMGLDKDEVEKLLKFGAYSMFAEQDTGEEERRLLEDDIDKILERSSTVVRYESGGEKQIGSSGFSTATFEAGESGPKLDINDKNFWDKVLPETNSAESLLSKLTETSSMSEEQQKKFMEDLKELVETGINAKEGGDYFKSDELVSLLTQFKYSEHLFSKEQRAKADEWIEKLEKRSLRKRGGRKTIIESQDSQQTEEQEQSSKGVKSKSKAKTSKSKSKSKASSSKAEPKKTLVKTGGWFKAERQRLHQGFMAFGWGRWQEILEHSKLENAHTTQDVASLCESMVLLFRDICDGEETKQICLDLINKGIKPFDEETFDIAAFSQMNNTQNSEAEEGPRHELEFSEAYQGQMFEIELPSDEEFIKGTNPCYVIARIYNIDEKKKKRSRQRTYRNAMVKGFKMGVVQRVPLTKEELKEGITDITVPGISGGYEIKFVAGDFSRSSTLFEIRDTHPILLESEFKEAASKSAKTWVKKLQFMDELSIVVDAFGKKLDKCEFPKCTTKPPTDWWTIEDDRNMLAGIHKHGFAKYNAIRNDEEFTFTQREQWPTVSDLNKRARRLVEDLLVMATGKERFLSKIHTEWTKREMTDFQRTILTFGLCPDDKGTPQWQIIKDKAKLNKTPSSIEEFAEAYQSMCHKLVESEEIEPAKLSSLEKKIQEFLTPTTAKKALHHIQVMRLLRRFVFGNMYNYRGKYKYLKTKGLPKWWKKEKHDEQLLEGVLIHGFDFRKIANDDSLKFDEMPVVGGKPSFPREGLCTQHLEDIGLLFEKLHKYGSPSKPKSEWRRTPHKRHLEVRSPPKHVAPSKPLRRRRKIQTKLDVKSSASSSTTKDKENDSESSSDTQVARNLSKEKDWENSDVFDPIESSSNSDFEEPPVVPAKRKAGSSNDNEPPTKKQKTSNNNNANGK